MLMLGVETSCDDTSIAIVDDHRRIWANQVSSQVTEHAAFGGVVPELASRAHLEQLVPVFQQALAAARLTLSDMDAIAVTYGPGLAGSLLMGLNFAKSLSLAQGLPLVPVNHIRGHVRACFLEHGEIPLPALALIVSGGHSHLFLLREDQSLVLLTKTRDDSAGEAFDKLAKMLHLGFPGGPMVDKLAREGDPKAFAFSFPRFSDGSHDYSFSGLKTAASRMIEKEPQAFADPQSQAVKDLCASFQQAAVGQLINRLRLGLKRERRVCSVLLGGGVACNSLLRSEVIRTATDYGKRAFISQPKLCTDNAAMIAAEGLRLFQNGVRAGLDLSHNAALKAYDSVDLL